MMRNDTAFCISLLPYNTERKEVKEEDRKIARDIRREWIERMTNSEDKFSKFKTN